MYNKEQALAVVRNLLPNTTIKKIVETSDRYIFQIFTTDEIEGELDPFYHFNKNNGEFSDFCLFEDPEVEAIAALLEQA